MLEASPATFDNAINLRLARLLRKRTAPCARCHRPLQATRNARRAGHRFGARCVCGVVLAGDEHHPDPSQVLPAGALDVPGFRASKRRWCPEDEREDEAWYWAAPILLDLDQHPDATADWFSSRDLPRKWHGAEADDDEESRWNDHVEYAAGLVRGELELGKPPDDLLDVVSLMALAAPGTVATRALTRRGLGGSAASEPWLRDAAAQIAWGFRSLFNLFEAIAVLRRGAEETPYWRRVLEYGAAGCLQAVVDEHAHLLRDLEGLTDKPPEDKAREIAIGMQQALSLRASTSQADQIDPDAAEPIVARRMRNNCALRFGNQRSEDGSDGVRIDRVRGAFNSPYRPFVLATTSFGQEGLDFHAYSHAVVHWNLPSNPVDLEQREGRVHRYKGHAVRKNVAHEHGREAIQTAGGDVWERLFEIAAERTDDGGRGLKPYWVFPGEFAIERHVPRLPLSREEHQLAALKRSLAIYRMVFGQPRQDDLMAFLLAQLGEDRLRSLVGLLQIDLSPSGTRPATVGRPIDPGMYILEPIAETFEAMFAMRPRYRMHRKGWVRLDHPGGPGDAEWLIYQNRNVETVNIWYRGDQRGIDQQTQQRILDGLRDSSLPDGAEVTGGAYDDGKRWILVSIGGFRYDDDSNWEELRAKLASAMELFLRVVDEVSNASQPSA